MEEGFIEDVFKLISRNSSINPLLLYDMTPFEIFNFIEARGLADKDELTGLAQCVRLGVNSAMSGKPLKLFEDDNKASKRDRDRDELRELDEMGL